jgi:hypothetical protein
MEEPYVTTFMRTICEHAYLNMMVHLVQTFEPTKEPDVTTFTRTLHKYAQLNIIVH